MLISLASNSQFRHLGFTVCYVTGILATLIFIGKPIFKVSEQNRAVHYLHCAFSGMPFTEIGVCSRYSPGQGKFQRITMHAPKNF